jgi:hypothetical protein
MALLLLVACVTAPAMAQVRSSARERVVCFLGCTMPARAAVPVISPRPGSTN